MFARQMGEEYVPSRWNKKTSRERKVRKMPPTLSSFYFRRRSQQRWLWESSIFPYTLFSLLLFSFALILTSIADPQMETNVFCFVLFLLGFAVTADNVNCTNDFLFLMWEDGLVYLKPSTASASEQYCTATMIYNVVAVSRIHDQLSK